MLFRSLCKVFVKKVNSTNWLSKGYNKMSFIKWTHIYNCSFNPYVHYFLADCSDLLQFATVFTSGVFEVTTWRTSTKTLIYCDMATANGGWTVCCLMYFFHKPMMCLHFLSIKHALTINVYVYLYYPKRYISRYSNVALTGRWTSTVTSLLTKMDSVV